MYSKFIHWLEDDKNAWLVTWCSIGFLILFYILIK